MTIDPKLAELAQSTRALRRDSIVDEDPQPSAPPVEAAAGIGSTGSTLTSAAPAAVGGIATAASQPTPFSYSFLTAMLSMHPDNVNRILVDRGYTPIQHPASEDPARIYPALDTTPASAPVIDTTVLSTQFSRLFLKPLPIFASFVESYLNRPLAEAIPAYKKVKKTNPHLDAALSAVKKEANKASFTLNPSEPLAETHCIATLARAIVHHAIAKTAANSTSDKMSTDQFIAEVLRGLDVEIAQLHHKEISPEKRALIEVALRRNCAEKLVEALKYMLYNTSSSGHAAFDKDIICITENLHSFATRGGVFKPCFDLTALVMNLASAEMETFTERYTETFFSSETRSVSLNLTELNNAYRTYLQGTLVPDSTDPRTALFIDTFVNKSVGRAENTLQARCIGNALRSRDLAQFAADLKKLDATIGLLKKIDITHAVEEYFRLMPTASEKTLGKKVELCNRLLARYELPVKLEMAKRLLQVLQELEMPAYKTAAASLTLPSTWKSDLQQVLECFTRSGRFAEVKINEAGELVEVAPMAADAVQPGTGSATEFETINRAFLSPLISAVMRNAEAKIAQREKALSTPSKARVLTMQECVPLYLETIREAVEAVAANTQEADRASAKALVEEFLRNACTQRITLFPQFQAHKEKFNETGYLPLEVYADAVAVGNLATDNGGLLMRRNPLQPALNAIFGDATKIGNDIAVIEGQESNPSLTAPQKAVLAAKKQTLAWAREMLRPEATEFIMPPMLILPERPIAAPVEQVVAVAPTPAPIVAAAVRTAPTVMREDINGTDGIAFDATRTDWFDGLRTEEKICVLSNLFMERMGLEGSIERKAREYLAAKKVNVHTSLTAMETGLRGDDIKALAQRLLIEYSLRTRTFEENARGTFQKMQDTGLGSNHAFLGEVYNQAVKEADGYEISEGDMSWAGKHWFNDGFSPSKDAVARLHNRKRAIQALMRFILKP